MKILIVESEPGVSQGAEDVLVEAGHDIVRCHVPRWQAVPCVGVDGVCPVASGVDVAVLVRNRSSSQPSVLEDGVRCAIRERVPLVEIGPPGLNPYSKWTAERLGPSEVGRLAAIAEDVVSRPNEELTSIGTTALRDRLANGGHRVDNATAIVHRRAEGSRVTVRLDREIPTSVARGAATWVASTIGRERGSGGHVDAMLDHSPT